MRYDFVKPLISSTVWVLDRVLRPEVTTGAVSLTQGVRPAGNVAILVKINGEAEGDLMLSMDSGTAARVSSRLHGDPGANASLPDLDALAELANMIAGSAISALNDLGFDFSVLPPAVLADLPPGVARPEREAMHVPLQTECGDMAMDIILSTELA